jgi:hypothetical protein
MRIPDTVLEHRIDVQPLLEIPQPDSRHGALIPDVHALVVMKESLVVDQRVYSETRGAEVTSAAQLLVQPEDYIPPGSLVTIYKGTPRERTSEVIATAFLEHSIAPSQAQAWLA